MSKADVKLDRLTVSMDNGYRTGYELLHETDRFSIRGPTPKVYPSSGGSCRVVYPRLNFIWRDDIDPNPAYPLDTLLADTFIGLGKETGLYNATDYGIQIFWSVENAEVTVKKGEIISAKGYPFTNP